MAKKWELVKKGYSRKIKDLIPKFLKKTAQKAQNSQLKDSYLWIFAKTCQKYRNKENI